MSSRESEKIYGSVEEAERQLGSDSIHKWNVKPLRILAA